MLTDEYMNALSLAELVELHANVGARIACLKETGRVEAIQKARELCAKYAIEPATIFDDAENGRKVRRRPPPKYTDLSGDWTGIGKAPRWVVGKPVQLMKIPTLVG